MDRKQYEKFAHVDAQHWWFEVRRDIVNEILQQLCLTPHATIIDVGTGTGGMIPVLARYGRLSVYEPDQDTLHHTIDTYKPKYPEVCFIGEELSSLRSLQESFDLVTAFDVLEHCENDLEILKAWLALVKPGGRLLVTVPAFDCLWGANDELSHHYRRYTKSSLQSLFTQAGISAKMRYFFFLGFLPCWLSRNAKEPLVRIFHAGKSSTPWDVSLPPRFLNNILYKAFAWEKHLQLDAKIPFGTSVVALISKSARQRRSAPTVRATAESHS